MIKKLYKFLLILSFITFSLILNAQPGGKPQPPMEPGGFHPGPDPYRPHQGPVGTATLLMLGLGSSYLTYKLNKNKK